MTKSRSKFALSRRTMLRGVVGGSTVTLALPLLEAMLNENGDALAGGGALPSRFMTWFWGNGAYLPNFEPAQVGPTWSLSPALAPLAPVKDYVNLVTGMRNPCPTKITHHEGMCVFNGYDIQVIQCCKAFNSHMGGPTIDQLVADVIGMDTLTRAIHVGMDQKTSTADGGTTLAALSHRGENLPEYPMYNPQTVWTLLFGNFNPKDDKELRLGIVGAVKEDINRLKGRLGSVDKNILDSHLDGIVELEQKINTAPPACMPPAQPTETNPDIPNQPLDVVHDVMADLIVKAFECDITRVASVLFHLGASHFHFWMINQGAYENHNDNSHSGGDAGGRYTAAVVFCMEQLSKLAQKLQAKTDPMGGNLLDSTIIYASTDCGVGWTHSINRQPIILIGHGRNKLKYPGVHSQAIATSASDLASGSPTTAGNTSNVLLSVLQAYNPAATSVGDLTNGAGSTTPLADIKA